jgi:diguanylate cyclase (GGDEF)-like protein
MAKPPLDFRGKATLGVGVTALVLLTPFSINNFIQGRLLLGCGSLAILAILALNAWWSSRGQYYPWLTLFVLVPTVLMFLVLVLRTQGIIGALWCYPAVAAFYFMLPERQAWLANVVMLGVLVPQIWSVLDPALTARVVATLLAVSIFSAIFVRVITDQQRRLEALAVTDPLTGLGNRARLEASLEEAVLQGARTSAPMSLVTIDIDHFKEVNDTRGHDAGDRVLAGIGALLRQRMRRTDKAFRTGGEEFLALLYGTDLANARRVAEELREAIAALGLLPDRHVTVSLGVAALRPGEDAAAWTKRADVNLYRAKAEGRNRVAA